MTLRLFSEVSDKDAVLEIGMVVVGLVGGRTAIAPDSISLEAALRALWHSLIPSPHHEIVHANSASCRRVRFVFEFVHEVALEDDHCAIGTRRRQ
jgi:hypothetical protein